MLKKLKYKSGLSLFDLMFSLMVFSLTLSIMAYSVVTQSKFQALVTNRARVVREARAALDAIEKYARFADPSTFNMLSSSYPRTSAPFVCRVSALRFVVDGNLVSYDIACASPPDDTMYLVIWNGGTPLCNIRIASHITEFTRIWTSATNELYIRITTTVYEQSVTMERRIFVLGE